MFGVSLPELLLVMAIVLIVFGPERLPEFARSFGKFMATLKRNTDAVRRELYNTVYTPAQEAAKPLTEAQQELRTFGQDLIEALDKPDPMCPDYVPPSEDSENDEKNADAKEGQTEAPDDPEKLA